MIKSGFRLQPYGGSQTRYPCPSCGKQGEFTRYVDTVTGELLPEYVGRCNRETSCGYHYPPKQYFADNNINNDNSWKQERKTTRGKSVAKKKTPSRPIKKESNENMITQKAEQATTQLQPSFIDYSLFKMSVSSIKAYERNCFVQYLISLFDIDITNELINRFFIGCASKWAGATVFWQMDSKGKVRTGRIMLYNSLTGKRVKSPYNHVTWIHSELLEKKIISEFNLQQCLFGEHQLIFDKSNKPVAICESEKTAIISSVFLPEYIWLAAGGINGLQPRKFEVLAGRKVLLVPDLKAYAAWQQEAKKIQMQVRTHIIVSDLLEKNATEADREKGLDLADYLVKRDPHYGWALSENEYPLLWDSKAPLLEERNFNYL